MVVPPIVTMLARRAAGIPGSLGVELAGERWVPLERAGVERAIVEGAAAEILGKRQVPISKSATVVVFVIRVGAEKEKTFSGIMGTAGDRTG